jgi:TRAP-type C4-dicarboxylate transport system permease small subunit
MTMRQRIRVAMDVLYWISATIASVALVLISAVIPWGVYTRYVLNAAAGWPEPAAVLLAIVLTFFGAAACYRADVHMRVLVFQRMMPPLVGRASAVLSDLVVGALCLFMTWWGFELCVTTWHQSIDEFPWLRVGITYLPIPIGGAITVCFVLERLLLGPAPDVIPSAYETAKE